MNIKIPPQNIDAEQALLCSMIINPDCRPEAREKLSPDDFYREAHGHIFSVLSDDLDLIGITRELEKQGILEKCGGRKYLMELSDVTSTSTGYKHYTEIIKECSNRRKLIGIGSQVSEKSYKLHIPLDDIYSEAKEALKALQPKGTQYYTSNKELIVKSFKIIEDRSRGEESQRVGVLTGFKNIDDNLHGIESRCTHYIAAERSTGKSALALNICENICKENQGVILYFTLESTDLALTFRRLSMETGIALTRIRTGNLRGDGEWEDLTRAANTLSGSKLLIIDNSKFKTFENIVNFCESFLLSSQEPLLMVVIDFIQLMRTLVKHNSRHLELSYISEQLNFLAKDLDCPLIIISQVTKKEGKYFLRESGDVENNADVVLILSAKDDIIKVDCVKGKDSGEWSTYLNFDRYKMRFRDRIE